MAVGGGEAPGRQVDQEVQQIETGKSVEEYREIIKGLKEKGVEGMNEKTLAPLMKQIHESDFNDSYKTELFNEIRAAIDDLKEPRKSFLNEMVSNMDRLESENTHITEGANLAEISEFINDDGVQYMFQNMTKTLENIDGINDVSSQMVIWSELSGVIKKIENAGDDKSDQTVEEMQKLSFNLSDIDTAILKPESIGDINKVLTPFISIISKIYGEEIGQEFKNVLEKTMFYSGNKILLENEAGINFDQINVTQGLMDFGEKITDDNKGELVSKLKNLSSNENFDQNDAIEDIISQTNEIDPETIKKLGNQDNTALAEQLIKFENENGTSFLSEWLEKGGVLAALIKMILGKEFSEAMNESNVKKQKALLNLVEISSTESTEGFKIDGVDFSTITGSDLKGFFASMDSHGIDYTKPDFWEHLMTGEVDDGSKIEGVDAIHAELKGENENVFTKENDFSNNNTGFKERLNAISKKAEEVEGAEANTGEGGTESNGEENQ